MPSDIPDDASYGARMTVDAFVANNGPQSAAVCNGIVAGYYAGRADSDAAARQRIETLERALTKFSKLDEFNTSSLSAYVAAEARAALIPAKQGEQ